MKISTPQLYSILLYGAADMCIFLLLLNRALIHMRNSKTKSTIILVVFLAMMGGSATLGLLLYRPPWVLASVAEIRLDCHFVVKHGVPFISVGAIVPGPDLSIQAQHDISLLNPFATQVSLTNRL